MPRPNHSTRAYQACLLALLCCAQVVDASPVDDAAAEWANGAVRSAELRLKDLLQKDPNASDARLLLGRIYLDLKDFVAAQYQIGLAQAAGASASATLEPLARSQLGQRRYDEVLRLTAGYADAEPAERVALLTLRGEAMLGQLDVVGAEASFSEAQALDPNADGALRGLASLALRAGDLATARRYLNEAVSFAPDSALAWEALGNLEYLANQPAQAVAALTKGIEHASSPWPLYYRRALARIDLGDVEGVRADAEAVSGVLPGLPALGFVRGWLDLMGQDPNAAIAKLESYLRGFPDDRRAQYYVAVALAQVGRDEPAEIYLRQVLEGSPGNRAASNLLAALRLRHNDAKGAEELVGVFANAEDASVEELDLLFRTLRAQGRQDEARALLERAAALHPDAIGIKLAWAELLPAEQSATAIRLLGEVLEQDPDNERAQQLLSRAQILAGDPAAALAAADAFATRAPMSPIAHMTRGALLAMNGDVDGARVALTRALELDPASTRAALLLAAVELNQDSADAEGAQAALRGLLEADPANAAGALALARIEGQTSGPTALESRLTAALQINPASQPLRLALAHSLIEAGQAERALTLLREAPRDQTNAPQMLFMRARAEAGAGSVDQASKTLARLAEGVPPSAPLSQLRAVLSAAAGDEPAAVEQLKDALTRDTAFALKPRGIATVLGRLPADTNLREVIDRLAAEVPGHPAMMATQGIYLIQQGEFDQAMAVFEQLHHDRPQDRAYTVEVVRGMVAARQPARASEVLDEWILRDPADLLPRMLLGELRMKNGEDAAAIAQYRQVIASHADNVVALNNLATLLIPQTPKDALGFAERALALQPTQPVIIDTAATALAAAKGPQEALAFLARMHKEQTNPSVSLLYAKALAKSGDLPQARALLMQLQQEPFPQRAEAQALLAELTTPR